MVQTTTWFIKDFIAELITANADFGNKPRAEIWASDLGKAYIDTYFSMKGEPVTNPTDGQGLMTFYIGKQIEQGLIEMLKKIGVAHESQDRLEIKLKGCLPVVGRPDIILEVSDWNMVGNQADSKLQSLVNKWREYYPNGLKKTVFEVKSINQFAWTYAKKEGFEKKYPHYVLQLFTYMYGLNLQEGHLVFVEKSNGYIEEVVIKRTPELEQKWTDEIAKISNYYLTDAQPPVPEQEWQISYSKFKDKIISLQGK